jgi:ferredoxin-like protein FixX
MCSVPSVANIKKKILCALSVLCGELFQHLCPAAYSEKEMDKIIKKYKFFLCVLCGLCEI